MDWSSLARKTPFERAGRAIALTGVVLPLLLIGHSKFAAFEVEALKPLIGSTPWLAWMYAVSSPVGVARFLGVIEIATAFLLVAPRVKSNTPRSPAKPRISSCRAHCRRSRGRTRGSFVTSRTFAG